MDSLTADVVTCIQQMFYCLFCVGQVLDTGDKGVNKTPDEAIMEHAIMPGAPLQIL